MAVLRICLTQYHRKYSTNPIVSYIANLFPVYSEGWLGMPPSQPSVRTSLLRPYHINLGIVEAGAAADGVGQAGVLEYRIF